MQNTIPILFQYQTTERCLYHWDISLTYHPEQWTCQKQSHFTPAATSDPQTGKEKNMSWHVCKHLKSFRGSNHYQDCIFSNFFVMNLLAKWKAKLNVVYEKLVDGTLQHQSTDLGILRYYMKLNFFMCVLMYSQKKKKNTACFWKPRMLYEASDNVYHCVGHRVSG